jgi:hypothetical protein
MAQEKDSRKEKGIVFTVPFDGSPGKELEVMAYAFDRRGRLLTSAAFKATAGRVKLDLDEKAARHARIFFAPVPPEGQKPGELDLAQLERWQAHQALWQFRPGQWQYELLPVPELNWRWWLWCRCRVRGRVVRPVTIQGVTYDMPVCHARVHICEVDRIPWLIPRLPDPEIWRLRDDLLKLLERPFPIPRPWPWPDPPPFRFDPGVIDPSPEALAAMQPGAALLDDVALNPQPLPPRLAMMAAMPSGVDPAEAVAFNPQPDPPAARAVMDEALEKAAALPQIPLAIRANLSSQSITIVRQALIDNVALLLPFLCRFDWFLYRLRCDEVAVLETDSNGRFDTTIWYRCFGDHPDLYFWVEYAIGGAWTTVYRPPMRCNTYWNYTCGSEVTIRITDPRVPWCGPAPRVNGNQLAILSIGENVGFQQIHGPLALANRGLTISGGGTSAGAPFGGVLEPRVYFGEDLIANGITHYRWSYRKIADSANNPVSGSWRAMDRQVIRHYAYVGPDGMLKFKPYFLGPDTDPALTVTGQNLFQIQPEDPPVGAWTPQVSAHENTASAHFETHLLAGGNAHLGAGKYELKLELFNSAGTRIPFRTGATVNVQPVVAVGNAPFGAGEVTTTPAPTENIIVDGGDQVAFRMIVHVDNIPCEAQIYPVKIGAAAANPCGFLNYNSTADLVTLSFKARHANDFATFRFRVNRGSVGTVETAGGRVGINPTDGYSEANGEYSKNVTAAHLLGGCVRAAFAETLHVWAMATNGWNRLSYLDRSGTPLAFALAPMTDLGD